MRPRFGINGRFLSRPITGTQRYAREIICGLDKLVEPDEVVVVVPEDARISEPLNLENIRVVRAKGRSGHLWEQAGYSKYLSRNGLLGMDLCGVGSLSNPGIVCIHDMAVRANPGFYSPLFTAWYRLHLSFLARISKRIITVSEFSKGEIERYYPAAKGNISVVYNAWQHIGRTCSDMGVLEKNGIDPQTYYFAMSSLAPNKNLKWLAETARLNPGETIVIAGAANARLFGKHDIPVAENVIYLGYISDAEARALMENCKAFLFPTFYEGFGLPPIEAMACGAPAIVSDNACMREVYGNCVAYVDPNIPVRNLNELLSEARGKDASPALHKYSWDASAEKLYGIMGEVWASSRLGSADRGSI